MLGNGRLEAQCFDGEKRLAHIRGKMRKKVCAVPHSAWRCGGGADTISLQVWINQGDIILLSLRDFQDDKADVIVKYTADEARSCAFHSLHDPDTVILTPTTVKAYGELPENAKINETDLNEEDGDCGFEFGEDGEIDIDDI